jgi:hypothetical protein
MARTNFKTASRALPHRYRQNPPLVASLRWMDVEDKIVNACAAESNPLALACEIASLAVRWYDDELENIPEGSSIFVVTKREREELASLLSQVHRTFPEHIDAAQVFLDLSPRVTADEFFVAAWNALSYFRRRAGLRP